MVFHHTFDPDEIIPNTQKYVGGRGMTVDLLFNEEGGLLSCRRNENSKRMAADYLSQYETHTPRRSDIYSNAKLLFILLVILIMFWLWHSQEDQVDQYQMMSNDTLQSKYEHN